MTSFGVKAEMEQCAQNHVKLSTSCGTPESANGNSTKDDSHDQKLMKKESPNSPSPVKRWEIGPLLQSFKSKMASFTEIVMSPVRLFKPTDTLSSIMPPDQHEQLSLESTTCTEGSETTDDKCKNVLLSKRPSSERMQCNSPPKRHRVAQRLSFETVSTSNHESVLECNEMHSDEGVATSEDQTERPAGQRETAYQEGEFDLHFSATQSTVLHSDLTESPDKPKNSSSTSTDGSGHKESCVQATRKSPRKMFKRISETAAELASGPKALDESIKDFHSIIVKERKHLSKKISDTSNSTSVGLVRPKRCRQALRTETKEDMAAKCKHEFQKSEGVGMRREKDKKFKDSSITLEMSEEDVICVQMRKRRKGISTEQILQSPDIGLDTTGIEIRNSETVESCESTEMKKMGHEKTSKTNFRRNKKYKVLQTSNDVDTNPSSQIVTGNIVLDKTLHISIVNTLNDGYYENSKQTGLQIHEAEESKARKLRQHVFKSARKASSQKRSLCPPKHKFEDFSITPVVDPAGPSGPSKRKLYQSDRSCEELQRAFTLSEKQMTSLSNSEFDKNRLGIPSVHPLSRVLLQSEKEAKPNRQVKTATRQKRKQHAFVTKRKTRAEDKAKIPEKMMEAIPVESLSGSGSNRLLRSFSCPELPSLIFSDCHAPPSHTHEKCSTSPTKESTAIPLPVHIHSLSKRTRRHTVCSVEIEREFAPLCLRKEVYPATRGGPSSPSNSLTALTLFFLSSPLAFLSKSSSHSDTSRFTSSYVTPSSPSLCSSPYASTLKSSDPVTDPSTVSTPSPEIPSVSSLCSLSQSALGGDQGILQMECGRALDEDRSSFSLQLSTVISEEKALSDSEIRSDNKEGQRGKVSSIRICKRMPKPQNNLTPMGLPKVIRIKKKDFSLEEIYTNKNFCKPPDGRLETIFEVPLNRRDGSQVVVSQKKIKRFVEFPELGVARKPKKPLVGGTAGVGAQRKAGGYSGICRTRRGVGTSSKGEDGLNLQELDSLLCSKLQELDTWIALQQVSC